jgi:cytochrome P450
MSTTLSPAPALATLRSLNDLPGPRPMPLVGNALQVKLSRLHQDIEAWALQYGPLMRVKLGRVTVMVVTDHELFHTLLRQRPEQFSRPSRMAEVMGEMGLPQGVFLAEGEQWARQRRMVMASFAPGQVRSYFPSLLRVTHKLKQRWQATVARQDDIDLQADLMRFTVDAVAGLAFGVEVDTLSSDGDVIQQHLDQIFPTIWRRVHALVPYWRVVKLPRDRALDHSVKVVHEAIAGFMADARVRLQDPARRASPPNLLEAMLVAADEPGSGMTDTDVCGNVFTMLLAGEDTTATSLSWLIHLLWGQPAILARLKAEVDAVMPEELAAWTPDHLERLDLLEACIHESMRLKPVGPFNVVEALSDTEVAGVHVPKGTPVLLLMRHDCLQEQYFEQAQQFKPERWMAGQAAASQHGPKRVSMPFGGGPRICPGRYLALMEIKLAMAMLLQQFDINFVGRDDGQEPLEHMALTMVPMGLRMRLRVRSPFPVTA